jgi:hypothetical protein
MRLSRRSLFILVLVALMGASLAVVATSGGKAATSAGVGFYSDGPEGSSILASDEGTATQAADPLAADPAKQEPVLDKFHSKDPFRTVYADSTGSGSTSGTVPTNGGGGGGTAEQPTSADVRINSVDYKAVKVDTKLPPGDPQFTVTSITSSGVTFTLKEGNQFEDGSTSVTVAEGQVVAVKNKSTAKSYTLGVVKLNYAGTSGGSGGTSGSGSGSSSNSGSSVSQAGHSIKVLSIDSQNGVASVTLVVDGKTYADKKVGDTISTDWGQIKVVSINASAQTVVILHGDEQLTLQVGQSYAK